MSRVSLLVILIFLSGCAALKNDQQSKAVPEVKYVNSANYTEPDPIKLPELPKPVAPAPIQYMPVEKFVPAVESKNPEEAIAKAQAESKETATDEKFVNAVTQYTYQEGLIYEVFCSPIQITDVIFQPGEQFLLNNIGVGDTSRWFFSSTMSGAGENLRQHLFIKPKTTGLHTTMVIPTTKRTYYLDLKSFRGTYQTGVSWDYPFDRYQQEAKQALSSYTKQNNEVQGIRLENANFDYEIVGNAPFRPTRVFDDGSKTYIAMPDNIDKTGELPPLFTISENNKTNLVNYRYQSKYFIVDSIFEAAVLKMGSKEHQKVYIYNKKLNTKPITQNGWVVHSQ